MIQCLPHPSTSPILEVTNEVPPTVSYTTLGGICLGGFKDTPPMTRSLTHHNWEACNEVDDEELFEILEEMWEEVSEAGNALYHIYKWWWIFLWDV